MKVLGIVGSPRKKGNTDILVEAVLSGANSMGTETEKIYLADYQFKGCTGCEGCSKTYDCVINDGMQEIYNKIEEADALVLGSPTYFYNVTGITKLFLDRLFKYEIFDDDDRSVWLSPNEVMGLKYAVSVAVCEQNNEEDMGYSSITMDKTLQAVGYRVVQSIKALHLFEKGKAKGNAELIEESKRAGQKLAKTLLLAEKVENKLKKVY